MSSSKSFKLITWNIDMESGFPQFQSMVDKILEIDPDVIFLQEVTFDSLDFFTSKLKEKGYSIIKKDRVIHYFIVTIIKTKTTAMKKVQIIDFPESQFARHLLLTEVEWNNQKIHLINSHLESIYSNSKERKKQLIKTFELMQNLKSTAPVIFAGDTNLRDKEVTEVGGLPEGIKDVWEILGRPKNCEFTWETERVKKPKRSMPVSQLRFDRIFFVSGSGTSINPQEILPVGKEKLPSGEYPSDHIGLFTSFKLG